MISLQVEPKLHPLEWEEFCEQFPEYTIALDGAVIGPPKYDIQGKRVNFNHHENVDRLCTRATCAQVLLAIKQGLFKLFQKNGKPHASIFVNDCDQDVCTAWYLLKHYIITQQIDQEHRHRLRQLVQMEDLLDATAGAYPFPIDDPLLAELAWIYDPYNKFRASGEIDKKEKGAYEKVIHDVENRITRFIHNEGDEIELDTRYEILNEQHGWVIVKEIGANARTGLFADNHQAFLSVRQRPDGNYNYALGRMSIFIEKFDIPKFLKALNKAEGLTNKTGWGGSQTIAGSPRVLGSNLTPKEVIEIMNNVIKKH
jgi:hypothetical protein